MARKKGPHYVDNKELYEELKLYIYACREAEESDEQRPQMSNYLGEAIYKIAHKLANRPNFIGYSYKEEMIFDGIENCILYLHNFNPEKYKNAFAYITQIIWFAFLRRIQKEQKQQYIKTKAMINSQIMNTLVDSPEDSRHFDSLSIDLYSEQNVELLKKFEKKKKPAKKATTKKKGIENFVEEEDDE